MVRISTCDLAGEQGPRKACQHDYGMLRGQVASTWTTWVTTWTYAHMYACTGIHACTAHTHKMSASPLQWSTANQELNKWEPLMSLGALCTSVKWRLFDGWLGDSQRDYLTCERQVCRKNNDKRVSWDMSEDILCNITNSSNNPTLCQIVRGQIQSFLFIAQK